jgi:hypothetical protein
VLKSRDACEPLWRNPDLIEKSSLDVAPSDARMSRDRIDLDDSAHLENPGNRRSHAPIDVGSVETPQKRVLNERRSLRRIIRAVENTAQRTSEITVYLRYLNR